MLTHKTNSYKAIEFAYQTLSLLSAYLSTDVIVNRFYFQNEDVILNFSIFGKKYVLHVSNETLSCEIWNTQTKALIKQRYTEEEIIEGKFIRN